MIFVTVGAQMPFDRMVRAVDTWAGASGRDDVYAQIGVGDYRPSKIHWSTFLPPEEFKRRFAQASAIVAHAGIGSIVTALELGKPILVMPRRADLRETRNDHQIATAERFSRYSSVAVAWDERELQAKLDRMGEMQGQHAVGPHASRELLEALRQFIDSPLVP